MIKAILSDFSYVLATPNENNWAINQELFNYYEQLKNKGIKVCLYTASFAYELPEIKAQLNPVISQIFSSKELKLNKTENSSYMSLAKKLKLKPEEIVFVDDQLVNVEAAREAGMPIIYFTSTQEAIKKLSTLVQ